ncbi:hypothetical protein JMJ58_12815 [Haloterrigena salifodinae]|uniref:Uncharacterized protein n=1 Tax=Haloterrigena salifodinae TaxID=2675099 RepID=A0A8T8DX82_9EURY|nr:hypothetical protein [Haloterrigena salifodinae]QRV13833.1 hypothetical protein JMJ58_12815 [Haloterrigena salifodinae]
MNFLREWPESDPENATEHGRRYLIPLLLGGLISLAILYDYGIATIEDFALFTSAMVLIDLFQFSTLIRMATVVDPAVGGVLGAIGLELLTKVVRGVGAISAAIRYFFNIRS